MTDEPIEIDWSIDPRQFTHRSPKAVASIETDAIQRMVGPNGVGSRVTIEDVLDGSVRVDIEAGSHELDFELGINVNLDPADAIRFGQALFVAAQKASEADFEEVEGHDCQQ